MPTDLEIARQARLIPIATLAESIGLKADEVEPYGHYKAKINLQALHRLRDKSDGRYICVTGINPTPLGEGKTVVTIGLAQALRRLGRRSLSTLRQPSMGPVFGVKGGATGGGHSQVVPMEEINLHFTGDFHAVAAAHNLLAALIDNHLHQGNTLGFDPEAILWRRSLDLNDRALRRVRIALGGGSSGIERETGFDITAASEVMAILSLSESPRDLKERLGRILVGVGRDGRGIRARAVKADGAMAAVLRDALKPNLVQNLEGGGALIHCGPFANVAHGNNSILADRLALKLADFVVTESGFGSECGAEKLFDIKCRISGIVPSAAVIVCSARALKLHGGAAIDTRDRSSWMRPDVAAVSRGCANLAKHIENVRLFGLPAVVAINRFQGDSGAEVDEVIARARAAGAFAAVPVEVWAHGGEGGLELAEAVVRATDSPANFRPLYSLDLPIEEKIETIARKVYGAAGVSYSDTARTKIDFFRREGLSNLPICMAKTPLSLSHDPKLKGRPEGFTLPVTDVRAATGAGYLYPLVGNIMTMPGLPPTPAANGIDLDDEGNVLGLS
ncbi:MAG TPA: formate--tetrahydrofolate ligase [Candidatus Polarisedimenticolia bacterium]|nr:formate--tetrahydrofolate ligase [Candidatus Polarisedimenticolia bacterium]